MRRASIAIGIAVLLLSACNVTTTVHAVKHASSSEHETVTSSGCGIERWAVKTATDAGASQINLNPQDTSIQRLGAIPAPTDPTTRVFPTEDTNYRITATIVAIKREADSDYHLALSDGAGRTMIAESPAPSCAQGSRLLAEITDVRNTISQACPHVPTGDYETTSIPALLTGVGFFDRIHGQRGVAPNGIELHPLTAVTLNGRCG